MKVKIYKTADGKSPFDEWLKALRDKTVITRIISRLSRIASDNFGDWRPVGQGVSELRLSFGSGYRIYYGVDHGCLVVLLLGGDKASQPKDIKLAHFYWNDHLRRGKYEKN